MRILMGFLVVVLVAIPSHAYFPIQCNSKHADGDYREASAIIVGHVAGFERIVSNEKEKLKNGKEFEYTVYTYYAKVQIGRSISGGLKRGDEIRVFEGVAMHEKGDALSQPHAIMQCSTHASAGMQLGAAYIFALTEKRLNKDYVWYELRSCHHSLHPIVWILNEDSGIQETKVKVQKDAAEKVQYVAVEAFLEQLKKRSDAPPAK